MNQQQQPNEHTVRNLVIFIVVTLGIGWLGVAVNRAVGTPDGQQGLGMLVWLAVPMATGLLLRALGGDGWKDLGVKPHLRSSWPWYLAALVLFPLVSLLPAILGPVVGAFSWSGFAANGLGTFISLVAVAFVSSLFKNVFEEFAWRGYLTPRFDALRFNPFINHLLTGLIWAGWHIPYWLFMIDVQTFTPLSMPAFIVVAIPTLMVTAITYGELRLLSQSVWPAVILHSVANAVTATLVYDGFLDLQGTIGLVFSPGNDGILHSVLFTLVGVGLLLYRRGKAPRA